MYTVVLGLRVRNRVKAIGFEIHNALLTVKGARL